MGGDVWAMAIHAPRMAQKVVPGQFVMLKEPDSAHILGRPFSVAGVSDEEIFIIYQEAGKVTRQLPALAPGRRLLLWGPLGHGFKPGGHAPLFLGGGVGLAPVLFAWLKNPGATLLMGVDRWRRFSALKTFLAEFNCHSQIIAASPNSKITPGNIYVTSQRPEPGWQAECALALDPLTHENLKPFDSIMACGPWPMLKKTAELARDNSLPCQVAAEALMACGVGACQGCAVPQAGGGYLNLCQAGPVLSSLSLDWERI